jgi:cell division protein FtsI/penicillin-binding protein 2
VNPEAPWYRMTGVNEDRLTHAWFIGFAPVENPQIAFAILVEYGGSGGQAAAYIAREVIESCVEHGYLRLR